MTLVQPSPEQQAQIRTELNENISTRNQDLEHIKEWLKRQPHLPDFDGKRRRIVLRAFALVVGKINKHKKGGSFNKAKELKSVGAKSNWDLDWFKLMFKAL